MVCNMYTELKDEKLKQEVLKNLTIRKNKFYNFSLIRPIKYIINEKYIIIIYLNILCGSNNYLRIDIEYSVFSSPFKYGNFVTSSNFNFLECHISSLYKYKNKLEKITFQAVVEFSLLKESFYDLKYDFDCDTSKKAEFITIDDVLAVL